MKKSIFLIVIALVLLVSCSNSIVDEGIIIDLDENILYQLKNLAGNLSATDKAKIQAALQVSNKNAVWDSNGMTISDNDDGGTVLKLSSEWPSNLLTDKLPNPSNYGEIYCSSFKSGTKDKATVLLMWTEKQVKEYQKLLNEPEYSFGDATFKNIDGIKHYYYTKGSISLTLTYSSYSYESVGIKIIVNKQTTP